MTKDEELSPSGVSGLDVLLAGGLPRRIAVAITGHPGSGKTILATQIAFAHAQRGQTAVIATMTSEPHLKLLEALHDFDFFDDEQIGRKLQMVSAYPYLKKGAKELRTMLVETVRQHDAKILVLDGVRAMRDLWGQDAVVREFLYELGVALATTDCLAVYTAEYDLLTLKNLAEGTTVDAILSLAMVPAGAARVRTIEVAKLRGRPHLRGEHTMCIGREGITVHPRLETLRFQDKGLPPDVRVPFGLPALDRLVRGGLPKGSSTVIAGSTGIGKTLLALHFAATGAVEGEHALYVTFDESAASLVRRARGIGLDVDAHCRAGTLAIESISPIELDPDQTAARILDTVVRRNTQRLVVDSLADLIEPLTDLSRARQFVAALVHALRGLAVTTIFTREIPKVTGPELDFSDNPASVAAENLLFLRHVEQSGRMRRTLSILKMRSSEHDWFVRELVVDSTGIRVLEPTAGGDDRR